MQLSKSVINELLVTLSEVVDVFPGSLGSSL